MTDRDTTTVNGTATEKGETATETEIETGGNATNMWMTKDEILTEMRGKGGMREGTREGPDLVPATEETVNMDANAMHPRSKRPRKVNQLPR